MKAPPGVGGVQAGGRGSVVRLLTGENRPGFCKLSKSRIDRDRNGREYVGRLGASAGAGWGACWPGAVLGWPFWGGVRSIYDFDGKTAGKRAQVLIFSPFLPSCSSPPSSDVLAVSGWLCLFDLGGQVDGIGAACPSGRGAGRVVLSYGMGQGWPLSCRVCWPSPLLAVLGQSVRALGLVLGMGGDLRPTGLLIGKMHKDSIRNAA